MLGVSRPSSHKAWVLPGPPPLTAQARPGNSPAASGQSWVDKVDTVDSPVRVKVPTLGGNALTTEHKPAKVELQLGFGRSNRVAKLKLEIHVRMKTVKA